MDISEKNTKPDIRTGLEGRVSDVAEHDDRRLVFGGGETIRRAWSRALVFYDSDTPGNALARDEKAEVTFAFWLVQTLGRQPEPGDEVRLPDTFDRMMSELRPASPQSARLTMSLVGKDAITLTVNQKRRQSRAAQARAIGAQPATAAAFGDAGVKNKRAKVAKRRARVEPGVLLNTTLKQLARAPNPRKADKIEQLKELPTWSALRPSLPELLRNYPSVDAFAKEVDHLVSSFSRDGLSREFSEALQGFIRSQFFTDAVVTPVLKEVQDLAKRASDALAMLDAPRVVEFLADRIGFGGPKEKILLQLFGLGDERSMARLQNARREGKNLVDEIRVLRDKQRGVWGDLKAMASDPNARLGILKAFPELTRTALAGANFEGVSLDGSSPKVDHPSAAHETIEEELRQTHNHRPIEDWLFLAGSILAGAAAGSLFFLAALAVQVGIEVFKVLTAITEEDRDGLLRAAGFASEEQMSNTRGAAISAYVLGTAAGKALGPKLGVELGETLGELFKDNAIGKFFAVKSLSELTRFGIDELSKMIPPWITAKPVDGETPTPREELMHQQALIEAALDARGVDMTELAAGRQGDILADDELRQAAITAFTATYGMGLLAMTPEAVAEAFRAELEQVQKASVLASRQRK